MKRMLKSWPGSSSTARRGEGCGGLPRMAGKATPDRHKIVDIIIDNAGRLA